MNYNCLEMSICFILIVQSYLQPHNLVAYLTNNKGLILELSREKVKMENCLIFFLLTVESS